MAKKVHIVTDSTADLPAQLTSAFDITVVPLKIFFGEKVFRDGIELTKEEFFHKMTLSPELPKTSQPAPADFVDAYLPAMARGEEIISIHLSRELSGTYQSALMARSLINYEKIEVIDSGLVSGALGLIVLYAAQMAKAGGSKEEILAAIERWQRSLTVYFIIDSLEHLARGGRIGRARAFLGTVLNVKPICTLREGIIYPFEKVRNREKAIQRVAQVIAESLPAGSKVALFFAHGQNESARNELERAVQQAIAGKAEIVNMVREQVGAVVGTHTGPSFIGVAALPL